ncbi:murein biosynthesis integral membrane protein MurJ [Membranihabitans marinus]|uniref:Murein biosynthesis integral membrane protein MurJ n=2 Tax=Nesterenkonia rhizosphaerae TaxID=1348272 RepID=A0ABP9FR36_9MICC
MAAASALMAAGTLVSRVLGFIRTALLAVAIGSTTVIADVFEKANSIPNIIYLLLAGGMFNVVLVPQLIKAAKQPDRGADYTSRLLTLTVLVLAGFTVLITLAAYPIIRVLTLDWSPEMLTLGTAFALWTLPQIFFYGLYAVTGQVLNANARFGWYMWAPVLNNLIVIGVIVSFIWTFSAHSAGGDQLAEWTTQQTIWLAAGHTVGIIAQALLLLWPLSKLRIKLRPKFGLRGMGLRQTGTVAGWTLLTMLIGNVANLLYLRLISGATAAREQMGAEGARVPGEYAANVAELIAILPHSVFVLSIATVLFNQLSHSMHEGDTPRARELINEGLRIFAIPVTFCMAAVLVLSGPLGRIFSGAGEDAHLAGAAIGQLLVILALGMPFRSAAFYLLRAFYAAEDAKTPMWVFTTAAVVGLSTAYGAALVVDNQHVPYLVVGVFSGLHLLQYVICHVLVVRRWGSFDMPGVLAAYTRSGFAAAAAGAVGAGALWLLGGYSFGFAWNSIITAIISCAVTGTVMAVVFVATLRAMRVREFSQFMEPLSRRVPALKRLAG